MSTPPKTIIVVPCYNEAERIDLSAFRRYLHRAADVKLLLVNDGSRDRTAELLAVFAAEFPERCELLDLLNNVGKAEAVRRGMLAALDQQPERVGFWDADLATPLEAIDQFAELMDRRVEIDIVIGARVRLLGRMIERRPLRHYLGRVFATLASLVLGLPVYDTQCGAKLFRATAELKRLLATPFRTRWIFDVELLARYAASHPHGRRAAEAAIYELPLDRWCDVPGSKLRPRDFVRALFGLAGIYWTYGRRRKHATGEAVSGEAIPGVHLPAPRR